MGGIAARMRKSFVTKSAFKWFVASVDSYVLLKMKILCMEMPAFILFTTMALFIQHGL